MGLPICGISSICDPNKKYQNAIKKVTPLAYQEIQSIDNYMKMLDTIRSEEANNEENSKGDDLLGKLSALVKTMRDHGISGMETLPSITISSSVGFLGANTKNTWLKEIVPDGEKGSRYILSIAVYNENGKEFHVINSESMMIETLSREDIIKRFNSGRYEYQNSQYTIKALGKEVSIPNNNKRGER